MFEQGEDMFFDAKEYHSSNKHVANILSEKPKEEVPVEQIQEAVLDDMDAAWGEDDGMGDLLLEDDSAVNKEGTSDPLPTLICRTTSQTSLYLQVQEQILLKWH